MFGNKEKAFCRKTRHNTLQGNKLCAHLLGALHWNCTSTRVFVLCFPNWSHSTITKSQSSALLWPHHLCVPQKILERIQLYPTQTLSALPLLAPNTKPVRWKSSTDFLFAFSPGWVGEERMIEVSWKIITLYSEMQRSAIYNKESNCKGSHVSESNSPKATEQLLVLKTTRPLLTFFECQAQHHHQKEPWMWCVMIKQPC